MLFGAASDGWDGGYDKGGWGKGYDKGGWGEKGCDQGSGYEYHVLDADGLRILRGLRGHLKIFISFQACFSKLGCRFLDVNSTPKLNIYKNTGIGGRLHKGLGRLQRPNSSWI